MMHSKTHQRRLKGRRGFTLVELMVSSVIALIVIMAIFSLFSGMSNIFFTQNQTVDAQSSLRFAVQMVSQEVRRTGHLGSPSIGGDTLVCPKPALGGMLLADMNAIRIEDGVLPNGSPGSSIVFGGGGGLAANTNINPDTLWITGAFENPATFSLNQVQGSTVSLTTASLEDNIGGPAVGNESRFDAIFKPGRLVKLTGPSGSSQYSTISNSGGSPGATPFATVSLTGLTFSGTDDGGGNNFDCGISGISGEGYEMSVLNIYRYSVEEDPNNETKMNLVREEINPTTGLPFGPAVPILEYVVDFQVWIDCDTSGSIIPEIGADSNLGDDRGNASPDNCSGAGAEAARLAHIQISARTPREDKTVPHITRASPEAPILTFNADTNAAASSVVVTLSTVVEMDNLTLRNLK